jgi:hypothetical protein
MNDKGHVRGKLADVEQNHRWPAMRSELVKFSKRVYEEVEARTPPPPEGERAEGTGADSAQAKSEQPERIDATVSPSRLKAYQQYTWAIKQNPALDGGTDREVYDWLSEHLDDGEQLPTFATWGRYVRKARTAHGTGKNTSRRGRQTGRSIVHPDEI